MQLSVIIPTLNESELMPRLVRQLKSQQDINLEIVIADGGSTDDTIEIARDEGLKIATTSPGRGEQMNAGAAIATGDLLLFLHADSQLVGSTQLASAVETFTKKGVSDHLGHFPLVFVGTDGEPNERLDFYAAKTALNLPGTFNGDQGLLITRNNFESIGGFWTRLGYLEDQEFATRATHLTFITLPGAIHTSARRFEIEGFRERIILNTLIMGMFHLGRMSFFDDARKMYRAQSATDKLNLRPFFRLVSRHIFKRGPLKAIERIYRIGQYTAANFWQLRLYFDLKEDNVRDESHYRDHWTDSVIQNPVGNTVTMLLVVCWFLFSWLASELQDG